MDLKLVFQIKLYAWFCTVHKTHNIKGNKQPFQPFSKSSYISSNNNHHNVVDIKLNDKILFILKTHFQGNDVGVSEFLC